jgi:hypothetical protein
MKSTRNPAVETLRTDPGYRMVLDLPFHDLIPFVLGQIRKKGFMSALYLACNLIMLAMVILAILYAIVDPSFSGRDILFQSLMGILSGSILVIPVHELLHGLAYRLLGAKKILFGADIKQFIFYVTADRHPVSGRQIHFLALCPFVLINLATLLLTLFLFKGAFLFSAVFLLSHNVMCIGDFAISNYVWNSKRRLYSFDEPSGKRSYFYEEVGK